MWPRVLGHEAWSKLCASLVWPDSALWLSVVKGFRHFSTQSFRIDWWPDSFQPPLRESKPGLLGWKSPEWDGRAWLGASARFWPITPGEDRTNQLDSSGWIAWPIFWCRFCSLKPVAFDQTDGQPVESSTRRGKIRKLRKPRLRLNKIAEAILKVRF